MLLGIRIGFYPNHCSHSLPAYKVVLTVRLLHAISMCPSGQQQCPLPCPRFLWWGDSCRVDWPMAEVSGDLQWFEHCCYNMLNHADACHLTSAILFHAFPILFLAFVWFLLWKEGLEQRSDGCTGTTSLCLPRDDYKLTDRVKRFGVPNRSAWTCVLSAPNKSHQHEFDE